MSELCLRVTNMIGEVEFRQHEASVYQNWRMGSPKAIQTIKFDASDCFGIKHQWDEQDSGFQISLHNL